MQTTQKQVERLDKMVPGRWYQVPGPNSVVGICAVCGAVKPAVELVIRRLPWGRGEVWACRGNCAV